MNHTLESSPHSDCVARVLRRGLAFTTLPDGSLASVSEVTTDIDWYPGQVGDSPAGHLSEPRCMHAFSMTGTLAR